METSKYCLSGMPIRKAHKLPFTGQCKRAAGVGDIFHSDIIGPMVPSSTDGFRYISTFLNDHSRYLRVRCMTHGSTLSIVFAKVSEGFLGLGGVKVYRNFIRMARTNIWLCKNPLEELTILTSLSPRHIRLSWTELQNQLTARLWKAEDICCVKLVCLYVLMTWLLHAYVWSCVDAFLWNRATSIPSRTYKWIRGRNKEVEKFSTHTVAISWWKLLVFDWSLD